MDRGDQMALSGSASYYMQRGIAGSAGQPELHGSPTIHQLSNSNLSFQPNIGGGTLGSTLPLESSAISPHGVNVSAPSGVSSGEPVKRKRGRPRKYGPDGNVSLALTPLSSNHPGSGSGHSGSGTVTQSQKRGRGRPPGSGKKQQLASLGESMSGSAGMGFTPHIITIAVGEDIVSKIMAFTQQGPRAVCVLSANGAVSNVTLRQASSLGGSVTYEGRYEILCLSGSYFLSESGGSRNRSGALNVSLASPEGKIIGGGVCGMLIAACPVQVIVGSFLWGVSKTKNKKKDVEEVPVESDHQAVHNPVAMNNIMANQNLNPPSSIGTWPASRTMDMRNSHVDIDLMRG
ncbi:hypothetical protein QN277_023696 [Acacia crassicarpa]|uniref:AT-hook motif nuclear-localized protein n=1 Tax=Acacia crassicarpa TaxID=499986 RepID=A0AAE1MGM2_9FABA|nr:hypothetical protein QN277_023696 [Acacia crassicarpa]